MKVIIAGGRYYNDYQQLCEYCDRVLANTQVSEIVSGGAMGADSLGERYATANGYPIKPFPAAWNKHGRAAGPIRNAQMAKYADALIAFWDGKSKGTKNMIDTARNHGLKVRVCGY